MMDWLIWLIIGTAAITVLMLLPVIIIGAIERDFE